MNLESYTRFTREALKIKSEQVKVFQCNKQSQRNKECEQGYN